MQKAMGTCVSRVCRQIRLTDCKRRPIPEARSTGPTCSIAMSVEQMRKGDEKLTGHDICLLIVGCQQLQVERLGIGRGILGRGGDRDQDMTILIVVEGKAQDVERGSHAEVVDNRDSRRGLYDRKLWLKRKGQASGSRELAGYDVLRAWRLFDNESRIVQGREPRQLNLENRARG